MANMLQLAMIRLLGFGISLLDNWCVNLSGIKLEACPASRSHAMENIWYLPALMELRGFGKWERANSSITLAVEVHSMKVSPYLKMANGWRSPKMTRFTRWSEYGTCKRHLRESSSLGMRDPSIKLLSRLMESSW